MTLHSRQTCLSRTAFRITIAFIVVLGAILIYRATTNENKYCNNSTECYNLLKEKAQSLKESTANSLAGFAQQEPSAEQKERQQKEQDEAYEATLQNSEKKAVDMTPEEISNKAKEIEGEDQDILENVVDNKKAHLEKEYKTLTDTTLPRVKAAFVVLVRNRELYALRSSMRYLEDRFNHRYEYPWIFLNEEEFTDEFIEMTQSMTKAKVHYGLVPKEHWSYPEWIDQEHAKQCRQDMVDQNIIYGGSESYRHMCRYQSGFFMMHHLLDDLDYYWRVEPGVKFSCDIDYDPFRLMQERDLKYGFTIALREYKATIPTLWNATVDFAKKYPQYIYPRTKPDSLLNFISDDNGWSYNMCHFWSNFEIASLKYMRSEGYQAYFRHLDQAGGFFYERWGDAPVHSIAVAMMLKQSDVHWFYDIGYKHDNFEHCPTEEPWLTHSKCYCDPAVSFDSNSGSCTNLYMKTVNSTASSFIVTRPDKEEQFI